MYDVIENIVASFEVDISSVSHSCQRLQGSVRTNRFFWLINPNKEINAIFDLKTKAANSLS